ncbi:CwfJ C-terminus 1-domain-containing protein-like protein [Scheffersomyces amazonensis]|uniref:CwfJ C-terminus 1-domain-containing protein-like protein n=1 Tax=Scheffersomyces amazonensis TaxID=1078765 RepID=UPI00315C8921
MENKSKFLVLNPSVEGVDKVLGKANIQQSKNGPFEAVILLGDVLPHDKENIPTTKMNVPTYFSQGINGRSSVLNVIDDDKQLYDISNNLTFMKSLVSILKLQSGFNIMTISGNAEENEEETIKLVRANKLPIDILVTYHWPLAIANQQQLHLVGNQVVDSIVKLVKPRYLFAIGHDKGKFHENPVFTWKSGESTRFISLGEEGSGEKWFYAFSISSKIIPEDKDKVGENPFEVILPSLKRSIEDNSEQIVEIKKPKVVTPDECFFCLSNPKTETHMIISIATQSYLTTAKGPLTKPNSDSPFPGHLIIVPIEHIPTLRSKCSNVVESPLYQEIQKYLSSLLKAFLVKSDQYRLISYEVNRSANVHHAIQVIRVPIHVIPKFSKSLNFRVKVNNEHNQHRHSLEFVKYTDPNDPALLQIINNSDHIIFTIHLTESEVEIYVCELSDPAKLVDFQFPRRVLADLLFLKNRVSWERCKQDKVIESKDCEEFKKFYHDFDFTI